MTVFDLISRDAQLSTTTVPSVSTLMILLICLAITRFNPLRARILTSLIKHKSTLDREIKVSKSKRIIWVRSMPLARTDSLAVFCDGNMVDYVAWSDDGSDLATTRLHQTAVEKKMWSGSSDYVATQAIRPGIPWDEMRYAIDTNTVGDWAFPGGIDAEGVATPGSRNGPDDLPTIGPTSGPTPFFTQRPSESPSLSMNPSETPTSFPTSKLTKSPIVQTSRAVQAVPTRSPSVSLTKSPTQFV